MGRLLAGVVLLLAWLPVHAAEVYRWVDEQGKVHFSDTPPPGMATESEEVRGPQASSTPRANMPEPAPEPAAAGNGKAAAAAQEADERMRGCERAREILRSIDNLVVSGRYRQEDGSYRRYTQEEIDQKRSEAQAAEAEFCY